MRNLIRSAVSSPNSSSRGVLIIIKSYRHFRNKVLPVLPFDGIVILLFPLSNRNSVRKFFPFSFFDKSSPFSNLLPPAYLVSTFRLHRSLKALLHLDRRHRSPPTLCSASRSRISFLPVPDNIFQKFLCKTATPS